MRYLIFFLSQKLSTSHRSTVTNYFKCFPWCFCEFCLYTDNSWFLKLTSLIVYNLINLVSNYYILCFLSLVMLCFLSLVILCFLSLVILCAIITSLCVFSYSRSKYFCSYNYVHICLHEHLTNSNIVLNIFLNVQKMMFKYVSTKFNLFLNILNMISFKIVLMCIKLTFYKAFILFISSIIYQKLQINRMNLVQFFILGEIINYYVS